MLALGISLGYFSHIFQDGAPETSHRIDATTAEPTQSVEQPHASVQHRRDRHEAPPRVTHYTIPHAELRGEIGELFRDVVAYRAIDVIGCDVDLSVPPYEIEVPLEVLDPKLVIQLQDAA